MPKAAFINHKYKGKDLKLYYVNTLALELGRTNQTIRKWEIAGIIPKTPFKDTRGCRLYTRDMIDLIVQAAEETEIKQGGSLKNSSFSSKIHRRMKKLLKEKYDIGE